MGRLIASCVCFFFFQAEDGIRDDLVTGVQTCALPIWFLAAARQKPPTVFGNRLRRQFLVFLIFGRIENLYVRDDISHHVQHSPITADAESCRTGSIQTMGGQTMGGDTMTGCIALIVAAGRGVRAGGGLPKQYREMAGVPVLRHAALLFRGHARIDAVRVVIHPDDRALYDDATARLDLLPPVHGGATRQDSVRLGLESLARQPPPHGPIPDAARPLVDPQIIDRTLDSLAGGPGAIPALPVTDTLKRANAAAGASPMTAATVDRGGLWRAQTPQGFHFDKILAAHRAAIGADLPDDPALAERAGLPVALAMGSESNLTVTTGADLGRRLRLGRGAQGETRAGHGIHVV